MPYGRFNFGGNLKSSANFSPCGSYRYYLDRIWDESKPLCVWLMLNPSTADHTLNDPTVERCQRRTMMMSFGGLIVLNLFAIRSKDPRMLFRAGSPIGEENDDYIRRTLTKHKYVIGGWGVYGAFMNRGTEIRSMLRGIEGVKFYVLGMTNCGQPRHPLYLAYDLQPQEILA